MKPDPIPATPNLMALLCIIGGIMRGEVSQALAMQFLAIGAVVPQFGWLIRAWLSAEERVANGHFWAVAPGDEDNDGAAAADLRSGWVCQEGRVWLWRHVSKACTVIIPVRLHFRVRNAHSLRRRLVWSPRWVLSALSFSIFFALDLAESPNCALFVPVS
jgi:hypothetical protein